MIHYNPSRRSFLKAAQAAITSMGIFGTLDTDIPEWTLAPTPTTRTLFDVTAALDGAYAVGGGGVLIERTGGGTWSTILADGPRGNGNNLLGVDVTADGEYIWFVGASGTVGTYGIHGCGCGCRVTDLSEPDDCTNNFRDIAVTGDGGNATVVIADESGQIHRSQDDGDSWETLTPGDGSSIPAIDFHAPGRGHAADTNQSTFATDVDQTWERFGIEDRDESLYGLDSNGSDAVWVCSQDGQILEHDGRWSVASLGDCRLRDIEVRRDRSDGLTVGASGHVFRYTQVWNVETTPSEENLHAVTLGSADDRAFSTHDTVPELAVGASGTILER